MNKPLLMNKLFDRYVEECLPELEPRTQRDYLGIVAKLREVFGAREPASIKPRDIVAFLNVKKGRIHRNRMVTILSTVFKKAIFKWCLIESMNPCDKVERWATKPRERYVTDEEFKGFYATCPPPVQIAMDLALLTGQRQGDILGLRWAQCKTDGPRDSWFIEVRQGKTGKLLGIKISDAIETVLQRARLAEPQWPREYVLRTNNRGRHKDKGGRFSSYGFRALWQRLMREWAAAGNARWTFHDIRAKAVSDNKNLESAYLLAGHLDIAITRRTYKRNIQMVEPLR